ncbi:hypothetical protein [Nonomuraea sp. NPDC046570]|uniref:hypothetical protein n=1 Tax=Nonomuraea sp. NPDC046570 TaxID=3155255 RepID=UPI0033CE5529
MNPEVVSAEVMSVAEGGLVVNAEVTGVSEGGSVNPGVMSAAGGRSVNAVEAGPSSVGVMSVGEGGPCGALGWGAVRGEPVSEGRAKGQAVSTGVMGVASAGVMNVRENKVADAVAVDARRVKRRAAARRVSVLALMTLQMKADFGRRGIAVACGWRLGKNGGERRSVDGGGLEGGGCGRRVVSEA